ncbi:MAG TPA: DUF1499 domain-containing protein [Candidatus Accumulibacter phosphatis]|nr:MAG: hypothetical protein AW07_02799 [Candidatus Accumulibacter sp. SK-11]HAY29015.1 DUF1499 domain-containing protein [Accumulibacter sp.]HRL76721.1 DUF1499 domain-containing protein [Candidatus Accumulibacter phosphatis]HCN68991.1 DUF1499 domain-containing protein [Accumulibacter sp.]HCV12699.1 DUF1499 domain-containing protein [Accumulibacter sp.]
MRMRWWIAFGFLATAVGTLLAGQLGFFRGTPPGDLGVRAGMLKRPSATANSVSSQAHLWSGHAQGEQARIAPLPLLRGDGLATIAWLRALLQEQPGTIVVDSRPDYLYVQCETRLMKFVDDVEFWFDASSGVIQVRSASRVGRYDFGVNRRRIEELRNQLAVP